MRQFKNIFSKGTQYFLWENIYLDEKKYSSKALFSVFLNIFLWSAIESNPVYNIQIFNIKY